MGNSKSHLETQEFKCKGSNIEKRKDAKAFFFRKLFSGSGSGSLQDQHLLTLRTLW